MIDTSRASYEVYCNEEGIESGRTDAHWNAWAKMVMNYSQAVTLRHLAESALASHKHACGEAIIINHGATANVEFIDGNIIVSPPADEN